MYLYVSILYSCSNCFIMYTCVLNVHYLLVGCIENFLSGVFICYLSAIADVCNFISCTCEFILL